MMEELTPTYRLNPADPSGETHKMQNAVRSVSVTMTRSHAKPISRPSLSHHHIYIIKYLNFTVAAARDNLEFLQWIRKFWQANYGGGEYDAVGRRKGAPMEAPATVAPIATSSTRSSSTLTTGTRTGTGGRTPVGGHRAGSAASNEAVQMLRTQVQEMSAHLEGLEKERDFYFEKVRFGYSIPEYGVCLTCPAMFE